MDYHLGCRLQVSLSNLHPVTYTVIFEFLKHMAEIVPETHTSGFTAKMASFYHQAKLAGVPICHKYDSRTKHCQSSHC